MRNNNQELIPKKIRTLVYVFAQFVGAVLILTSSHSDVHGLCVFNLAAAAAFLAETFTDEEE